MDLVGFKELAVNAYRLLTGQKSDLPENVVAIVNVTISRVIGGENPNAKSLKLEVVEAGGGNFRVYFIILQTVSDIELYYKLLNLIDLSNFRSIHFVIIANHITYSRVFDMNCYIFFQNCRSRR